MTKLQSSQKVHALATEFESQIRARIEAYEKRTSLEFVPVLIPRARSYARDLFPYLLSASLALAWVGLVLPHPEWSHYTTLASFILFTLGFVALKIPTCLRRLVSQRAKQIAVATRARELFLEEEIFQTKNRTGVLILVSEFERAVFLLADKGLLAKVPAPRWQELGTLLASNFSEASPGASFIAALDQLVTECEKHFPPDDSGNELRDHVRRK